MGVVHFASRNCVFGQEKPQEIVVIFCPLTKEIKLQKNSKKLLTNGVFCSIMCKLLREKQKSQKFPEKAFETF